MNISPTMGLYSRWMLLIGLWLHVVLISGIKEYLQSTACTDTFAELECPIDHKIAIRNVAYGTRKTKCDPKILGENQCCSTKREDCFIYHKAAISSMNLYCSGRADCQASTKVTAGIDTTRCRNKPLYGVIVYDCIEESAIAELCSDTIKTAPRLFLTTPKYPSLFHGGYGSCRCLLQAPKNTIIGFSALDMIFSGVGFRPKECEQEFTVWSFEDNGTRVSLDCNDRMHYGYDRIVRDSGQDWMLTWNSQTRRENGRGRIWLVIDDELGKNNLTIQCTSTGKFPENAVTRGPTKPSSGFEFDIGIIVGIAVSGLFLILGTCLIFVYICRRKPREEKKKKKTKTAPVEEHEPSSEAFIGRSSPPESLKPFPDVCDGTGYSSGGITPTSTDDNATKYHQQQEDGKPRSKIKKKVSFKDILHIGGGGGNSSGGDDTSSNGTNSRPTSYISTKNSFSTFGKGREYAEPDSPVRPEWLNGAVVQPKKEALEYSYAYNTGPFAQIKNSPQKLTSPSVPKDDERDGAVVDQNSPKQIARKEQTVEDIARDNFKNFYANMVIGKIFEDDKDRFWEEGSYVPYAQVDNDEFMVVENGIYDTSS